VSARWGRRGHRVPLSRKGRDRRILLVGRGLGYAIAAKADRNLLLRIAELVYQQTTQEGAKAQILPAPGKPS
jgi:hypothetical protein